MIKVPKNRDQGTGLNGSISINNGIFAVCIRSTTFTTGRELVS